jgi:DNA-binding NtrC family response regulator/tetratricopeptide (TPR) repeat protein
MGNALALRALREQIRRLASFDALDNPYVPTLLLYGETGTGKSLVARVIHESGPRARGSFIAVNCAAIPESLLEAELFGFEAGAFTDAKRAKPGLFEAASGGTLFLDDIDALPLALQSKFLSAIEEKRVRRLGAVRDHHVDVKLIAATQQQLNDCVVRGHFRADLYHRLAVVVLEIPPLRERGEDILVLAQHYLQRYAQAHGLPPKQLHHTAAAWLRQHRWPGNVRELSHLMERATLLHPEALLDAPTLERLCLPQSPVSVQSPVVQEGGATLDEPTRIRQALIRTGGNAVRAAQLLGLSRNALRYRMRRYGIKRPDLADLLPPPVAASALPPARDTQTPTEQVRQAPGAIWEHKPVVVLAVALTFPPITHLHASHYEPWTLAATWEQLVAEKVQGFGGGFVQRSPSLLLAVFGVPRALEQMPQRAVQAALAIRRLTAESESIFAGAPRPALRIAIHSGMMLVNAQAAASDTPPLAIEDTLAYPVQLLGHAQSGDILVSPQIGRQIEPWCELQAQPISLATTASEQLTVYTVIGRRPQRTFPDGEQQHAQPYFVGRRQELSTLHELLDQVEAGQGQVVGIVGEPGVGKTRLINEFSRGLARQRVSWLEGRCVSYGNTVPYLPLLDILRQACQIVETDNPGPVAERVATTLQGMGIDGDAWAPYLLQLLGVKDGGAHLTELSPEATRMRTFTVLRHLFQATSQQTPLVIVVEDLQWLDHTSEAFFTSLVESLAATPILFLTTYRPGYRPPWIERSYVTQMPLQPLSRRDSLRLVSAALLPDRVSEPVIDIILSKAEGNPFFLEELARAVMQHGDVSTRLTIPDTIQGVLMARIDRLTDAPKRLLQTAAVLGRDVPLRLLETMWDGAEEPLAVLPELQHLEFLHVHGGPEDPSYLFRHALTQEVVYESLPLSRRHVLHTAAGRALEALYTDRIDEVYDRLAYHYAHSVETDKAIEYLTRFAEKAAQNFAHTEAVTALQDALFHVERTSSAERVRRSIDLILSQAFSLSVLGRFRDILDLLRRYREQLEQLHDPTLSGPYYFRLALTHTYLGEYEQAVNNAQHAITAAHQCDDHASMGKAYYVLALKEYWGGEPLQGVETSRQAVALLERSEERHWLGLAKFVLGMHYGFLGEFAPALAAEADVVDIAETTGDLRLQSLATWAIGWFLAMQGEWHKGVIACRDALAMAPDPVSMALARAYLGAAYLEQGDAAQAIAVLEQSIEQLERFQVRQTQGRMTVLLGIARGMQGELERARGLIHQGYALCHDAHHPYGVGWAQRALGYIDQACGALANAERSFQEALQTFTSLQARFEIGRTHLALAELAHMQGQDAIVTTNLTAAYRLFQSLRISLYVARTEAQAKAYAIPLST